VAWLNGCGRSVVVVVVAVVVVVVVADCALARPPERSRATPTTAPPTIAFASRPIVTPPSVRT
jgi:hypothetical protein